MENFKQPNTNKQTLDLREGWIQINQKDIERIINKKDRGNYWLFNKDRTWITTIQNGKIKNYEVNKTEILLSEEPEKASDIKQETKSEVLMDLLLSPENKVKDTKDAYERAKRSDKTTFWFISKDKKNKAVIVLDFSKGSTPKRTVYPLKEYDLKMEAVKV